MAPHPKSMPAPGSNNFTQFVNTTTTATTTTALPMLAQIHSEGKNVDKSKIGTTELIFCYGFLAIVFGAFISLLLIDVWRKHGPKRDPNERSFIMKRVDKAHEKYFICKDHFNRLFIGRKNVGNVDHAVARDFDSQAIIDRLAAKPASAETGTVAETTEEKNNGPMEGVEITVTPLDLPFLVNTDVEDVNVKDANAGNEKAAAGL
ncbi:hypothetical protein ACHAQJ_001847 [Trichoderma viride]